MASVERLTATSTPPATGQVSVGPGNPSVRGSSPADVHATAGSDTGHLEGGYDGRAIGESRRFNFSLVLTITAAENVLADLTKQVLRACRNSGEDAKATN